jgi:hypothetical protein
MIEKPMLFSSPMVKAILAGTKTQTRRVINDANSKCTAKISELDFNTFIEDSLFEPYYLKIARTSDETTHRLFPRKQIGDLVWVRETVSYFRQAGGSLQREKTKYKADEKWDGNELIKWTPSIHMPKDAARIWLQITDLRVERLRHITEKDSIKEGVSRYPKSPIYGYKNYLDNDGFCLTAKVSFQTLWEKINGKESWDENPWVWKIEFKVVSTTGRENVKA